MKTSIKNTAIQLIIFLLVSVPATAQIVFGGESDWYSDSGTAYDRNPLDPPVPIDNGLIILLFMGIVLGYYFLKVRKKKEI